MCNPVAAVFAISTALTVVGGVVQYQASKRASAYNEQTANVNAKVAEAQAIDAERQGALEANEARLKTRLTLASQQVGFAAQGVETSGSALDILGDTAMFGEVDQQRIRANAARRAFGFRFQGWDIKNQAAIDAYEGKVGRIGTILTTARGVADSYGSYRAAGGSFGRSSSKPNPYPGSKVGTGGW